MHSRTMAGRHANSLHPLTRCTLQFLGCSYAMSEKSAIKINAQVSPRACALLMLLLTYMSARTCIEGETGMGNWPRYCLRSRPAQRTRLKHTACMHCPPPAGPQVLPGPSQSGGVQVLCEKVHDHLRPLLRRLLRRLHWCVVLVWTMGAVRHAAGCGVHRH